MRLIFLSIIILSSTFCFAQQNDAFADSVLKDWKRLEVESIGKPFPSFTISNGKQKINNDSLITKVVFVNFWFEKCVPCIAELEALNDLYYTFKGDKRFHFISFTFENEETIKRIKNKYDLDFPIYSITKEECLRLNENSSYPSNIVVDKKGIIRFVKVGGKVEKKEASKEIEKKVYPEIRKLL